MVKGNVGLFVEKPLINRLITPVITPIVIGAGFLSRVMVFLWIPAAGYNLLVVQGSTGESILRAAVYALPFFSLMPLTTVNTASQAVSFPMRQLAVQLGVLTCAGGHEARPDWRR